MVTLSFSKSILEKLYENLLIAQKLGNIRLYRLTQALIWVGLKEIAKRNTGYLLSLSTMIVNHGIQPIALRKRQVLRIVFNF